MKAVRFKFLWFGIVVLTGAVLLVASIISGADTGVTSFAAALIAVAVLKIIQYAVILRNPEKRKQFEINSKEERLIMLAEKSGRLTLLISIFAELIAALILMFTKHRDIGMYICYVAAAQSFLYLIIYNIISHKN